MNSSLNIMIAEDESIILMGLKANLTELGHQVIAEAFDGEEAIKKALYYEPDLILIDINMPKTDGIEAIRRISQKKLIPCIIITGYNDEKLIKRATEAGAFAYLVKPVAKKEIEPAISIAVARSADFKQVNQELSDNKKALVNRKLVERAKGVLMDRLNLTEQTAMKLLQKKSNDRNLKLAIIAQEIIEADQKLRF
ncbi:ANTAR domain-containing response regulator [Halanaerobium salsuginis]|uniref:Stage 0 sporulation protein A homolog n=1 Tax=Halanaerobium salsuginis TaxID=29563 RepID=A0A1I4HGN5_9FIRM|nr:response regulator [Halanaerobium salsuginis]SFL40681.1 response regulator receiver and ANTAR domain protein [Halanaerobium salsuginis]